MRCSTVVNCGLSPLARGEHHHRQRSDPTHDQSTHDDQTIAIPNNDWKTLGGGIDSSAYDLGRFGAKLAAGQILDSLP